MGRSPLRWKNPVGAETEEIGDGETMKKERKEGNWTQQHARLSDLLAVTEALTGGRDSNAKDGTNFQFNSWCKSTKMEGGTGREDNPLPWRWTSAAPAVPDCQSGRACVPACLRAWTRSLALCLAASISTGLPVHFPFQSSLVRLDRATGAFPADPLAQ